MPKYKYRATFKACYDQHRNRNDQWFTPLRVIDKPDSSHDADVLPMFWIRFRDGIEIEAWPEEVLR